MVASDRKPVTVWYFGRRTATSEGFGGVRARMPDARRMARQPRAAQPQASPEPTARLEFWHAATKGDAESSVGDEFASQNAACDVGQSRGEHLDASGGSDGGVSRKWMGACVPSA